MSTYRQRLQDALLAARSRTSPYRRLYDICETAAFAVFFAGWLVAILSHL